MRSNALILGNTVRDAKGRILFVFPSVAYSCIWGYMRKQRTELCFHCYMYLPVVVECVDRGFFTIRLDGELEIPRQHPPWSGMCEYMERMRKEW